MYMRSLFVVVPIVLLLGACGGGGGGSTSSPAMPPLPAQPDPAPPPPEPEPPDPDPEPEPQPPPPPPPPPPSPSAQLESLLAVADTVTSFTSFFGSSIDDRGTQAKPAGLEMDDISLWWDDLLEPIGNRQGASRAFFEVREPTRSSAVENRFNYAGWMEHNFFALSTSSTVIDNPLDPAEYVTAHIHSIGDVSGSNPVSGNATWTGIMAGVDLRPGDAMGNLVEGDATLSIGDFVRPTVDVRFSNVSDQHTGAAIENMVWSSIPLTSGYFSGNGLQGHFYGPNHEEVGGTFAYGTSRQHLVVGAFGAKRE